MKWILFGVLLLGIVTYLIVITVNVVKKNKKIKNMEKTMQSLRFGALDNALQRDGTSPKMMIKVVIPNNDSLYFEKDRNISFGRAHSNNVCIDNNSVSKVHCCIFNKKDQLFIQDLNSSNYTVIIRYNEKHLLSSGEKQELKSGDSIMLGDILIKIKLIYYVEA